MKEMLPRSGASPAIETEHGNGAESASVDDMMVAAQHPEGTRDPRQVADVHLLPPRRRRWRVMLPVLLALLVVVAALYFFFRPAQAPAATNVRRGTIISTVETTGKLQAERSARLSFKSSGRVDRVIAKQGDRVRAGDVLAELDTASLRRQLEEAKTQLEISKLRLQQAREGAQPADIAAATAELEAATAGLNQVRAGGRAEDIAAAQAKLNQSQAALDALKKGASTQDVAAAQARVDQAKANRDLVAISSANATEQARIAMNLAAAGVENWLDPGGQYEQARLNYEAAKQSEKVQLEAADAKIKEAQEALDKLKAGPTAEELRQAEEAVAQARAGLDKVKKGATPEEITQAEAKVAAAQAALDKVKAGPTEANLAILDKQIALAQLSVDGATAQVADAQLTSPIDGTLLSIDLDVGEIVGGLQPVATVADVTSLRVKADIDEIDVGRVQAGQPVTVTLDSYPGVKMPGRIEDLAPGATLKQGSTVYQATISFTPLEGVTPREGMAANVDVTARRKDNVLLLPNRAFETVGTRQYVTISENGATRKVEVETGLTNATDTEVLSGVTEGQVVILR
jgi:HlyD family secretion protein